MYCGYFDKSKLALELALEHMLDILYIYYYGPSDDILDMFNYGRLDHPSYTLYHILCVAIDLGRFSVVEEVAKLMDIYDQEYNQDCGRISKLFLYIIEVESMKKYR